MASKFGEITEEQVALAVVQIAGGQRDGVASYSCIRAELPKLHRLSAADLAQSTTRPNESIWEQKIRNIKSHYMVPGNFIYEGFLQHLPRVGYRITAKGERLLSRYAA